MILVILYTANKPIDRENMKQKKPFNFLKHFTDVKYNLYYIFNDNNNTYFDCIMYMLWEIKIFVLYYNIWGRGRYEIVNFLSDTHTIMALE